MDSEHRHELKENDLASFLTHFGQWWAKWGNTLLIVFVVCTMTFLVYRLWSQRVATAHESAWSELAVETSPSGYQAIADLYTNPSVKVLAYLRGGDAALAQAMKDQQQADDSPDLADDASSASASAGDRLAQAQLLYEQALAAADLAVYRGNAMMGLACIAEMREDWEAARQHYQQIIDLAGDALPVLAQQAQARLRVLPQLAQPIVFAPPAPAPDPAPRVNLDVPALDLGSFDTPVIDLSHAPISAPQDDSDSSSTP